MRRDGGVQGEHTHRYIYISILFTSDYRNVSLIGYSTSWLTNSEALYAGERGMKVDDYVVGVLSSGVVWTSSRVAARRMSSCGVRAHLPVLLLCRAFSFE